MIKPQKFVGLEGLREFLKKCDERYGNIEAVIYKGAVNTVSDLDDPSTLRVGYMFTVVQQGITNQYFIEGAGQTVPAYSEVAVLNTAAEGQTPVLKYQVIGHLFNLEEKLSFGTAMPANPTDGQTFLYVGETVSTYEQYSETLTKDSSPVLLSLYESDGQVEPTYTPTTDVEPATVYKAWQRPNSEGYYYTLDKTPSVGATVYTISEGTATDAGVTVGSYDALRDGIVIAEGSFYPRTVAQDTYIPTKTYYEPVYFPEKGVVYTYSSSQSQWVPQVHQDMQEVTPAEIDALFN